MSRPLPRYTNTSHADNLKLDKIIGDTAPNNTNATIISLSSAADLRGIPCIARAVGGTQPGSDPLAELIRNNP